MKNHSMLRKLYLFLRLRVTMSFQNGPDNVNIETEMCFSRQSFVRTTNFLIIFASTKLMVISQLLYFEKQHKKITI